MPLLVVLAIASAACAEPSASAPGGSTLAASSARTDGVGNELLPVVDDATWARLADRPLRLSSVGPPIPCPKTATVEVSSYAGALAGPGPVYSSGNQLFYTRGVDGTLRAKVAWISRPEYTGPALVRGIRIDSPGAVRFVGGAHLGTELRFGYDTGVRAAGSEVGWRFLPSTVVVTAPGCYAFQIDGPDWTVTIVMETIANP
ncbi:MAG: hypothetical protein E6J13_03025 [Chloroflexi bacterium]|nr:MAG: hypothetical protein E6J13_03025 [Chloroflexota bacterium]